MRFLRKYIFANATLKLLSLGVSFLLWTTYTSEPFAEIGLQVPLEFTSMPPRLEISSAAFAFCSTSRMVTPSALRDEIASRI